MVGPVRKSLYDVATRQHCPEGFQGLCRQEARVAACYVGPRRCHAALHNVSHPRSSRVTRWGGEPDFPIFVHFHHMAIWCCVLQCKHGRRGRGRGLLRLWLRFGLWLRLWLRLLALLASLQHSHRKCLQPAQSSCQRVRTVTMRSPGMRSRGERVHETSKAKGRVRRPDNRTCHTPVTSAAGMGCTA